MNKLIEHYFPNNSEEKRIQINSAMESIKNIIDLCGDDPNREGLLESPYRFIKAFLEYTEGYNENPKKHLVKTFDVKQDDMVLVKDIEFYSMCEHHFAPFFGVAHVGYIPDKKVTGLSKIGRVVEGYARRFQVQERLTTQIAQAVNEVLEPKGVMVVLEAKHMCMCSRGVKKEQSSTITSAVHGLFHDNYNTRNEFLTLINK
ncbi:MULTISPECIES: GTP cyclohydrolase I FolE [Staphylococcus]|uniref:GTP cyclohydrolase I FolE n=1 Tax=Staphylococcus TaxID=1279 RepID=UPI000490810B|nr:GTP cyclohydrolase 1 [Staphylococcus warneri]